MTGSYLKDILAQNYAEGSVEQTSGGGVVACDGSRPFFIDSALIKITSSSKAFQFMMTSPNGNIFLVTGPFCGEFTGHR